MHRSGLIEIEAVLAVARHKSFRAAASELSMSPTALGKAVAQLEERLGARLFNRTTRSVALTAAGEAFVAEVAPALAAINGAMTRAREAREAPTGTLRINSSVTGARIVLASIVVEYLRRYPEVTVDLVTEARMIDIVRDGFDAGIRTVGRVPRDMITVPIGGALAFAIVGSPAYFRAHEKPTRPADLLAQRCIRVRRPNGEIYRWELEREGKTHELDVPGSLILDQMDLTLEAARAGAGLAYLPAWAIAPDSRERGARPGARRMDARDTGPVPLLSSRPPHAGDPARVHRPDWRAGAARQAQEVSLGPSEPRRGARALSSRQGAPDATSAPTHALGAASQP
ncbi:MAG: LysR substrate-binding domain-containing protein [Minicystis sp.]